MVETITGRTRRIAERFERLPWELRESFRSQDAGERVARMRRLETELLFELLPVVSWAERNLPAVAGLLKQRASGILGQAVACASLPIPEFEGGAMEAGADPTPGVIVAGTLLVMTRLFGGMLADLMPRIEASERSAGQPAGVDRPLPWEGDEDWERLEQTPRRLLRFMHGREQSDLAAVCRAVWERDPADVSEHALHAAIRKANKFLQRRESRRYLTKVRGRPVVRWA